MARLKTSATLLAAGLVVGACGGAGQRLTPHHNPSLSSVNQPVVQRTDYVLDLNAGGGGVPPAEMDRLAGWFESLDVGYGDRISVDEGAAYGDPRLRQDIAEVAASYGLLLSEGAPLSAGHIQPGTVRVIVSRTTAEVPGCPDWDQKKLNARITTSPNYGCATNSNLAAMIANPEDLVLGQTGTGSDAREATKSIQWYRNRVQTGVNGKLKSEKTGGN